MGWWQCNNEPSNTGPLWAGTADEYVHQVRMFAREVRAADATTKVMLGGCGYDMLSSPVGSASWQFFDTVVGAAGDSFGCFDVHLYDDRRHVPGHVQRVRNLMRSHGYEKEIVVGEHNGPTLFDFPGALAALEQAMMAAFAESAQVPAVAMSTTDLAEQMVVETPDRRAVRVRAARQRHRQRARPAAIAQRSPIARPPERGPGSQGRRTDWHRCGKDRLYRHGGGWPGVTTQLVRICEKQASLVVVALDDDSERAAKLANLMIDGFAS